MIERLEVTPGAGTVIRFGNLAAWAAPSASAELVSFLSESARNLAPSPVSGEQMAAHLVGVLERRDPEPHVPFVVVGPSEQGWTALLHGPVQVWDGARWTTANPEPGWLRASLSPRPALSVAAAGTAVAPLSPDTIWDLEAGVVPGGGFVLVPAVPSAPGTPLGMEAAGAHLQAAEETTVLALPDTGAPTELLPVGAGAGGEGPLVVVGEHGPAAEAAPEAAEAAEAAEWPDGPTEAPAETPTGEPTAPEPAGDHPATVEPAEEAPADEASEDEAPERPTEVPGPAPDPAPPGVVDLRSGAAHDRVVPYPPLPPAGDPPRPVAGAPVVAGIPCPRGHLNRPGMTLCARCARPIADGPGNQVSGTRPALGCLIADQGSVYRLDSGYLVGSDPGRDPTVRGRLARPLALPGDDVSPTHAEIRLHDWDVVVTDRASEAGTYVFEPGAATWERLRPYEPRVLQPGTHLAFGQRVVTFVSPWIPGGAGDQETSARY